MGEVIKLPVKRARCQMCLGHKAYQVQTPQGMMVSDPCNHCGGTGEEPDAKVS